MDAEDTEGSINQMVHEVEIPAEETESVTLKHAAVDGPMTPIDVIENIKLESYVNKTIVNDNNVVDVPVYEAKDKLLEEVRKMISEPPQELPTTITFTSSETTTLHQVPETTTEAPQVEETTKPSTVPVTTTTATETETIFVPIITNNNENINNYDDKFTVVTTTDSPLRVSFFGPTLLMASKRVVNYSFQWTFSLIYFIYLCSIKVGNYF